MLQPIKFMKSDALDARFQKMPQLKQSTSDLVDGIPEVRALQKKLESRITPSPSPSPSPLSARSFTPIAPSPTPDANHSNTRI